MWSKGGVRVKGQREKVNVSNSLTLRHVRAGNTQSPFWLSEGRHLLVTLLCEAHSWEQCFLWFPSCLGSSVCTFPLLPSSHS